MMHVYQVFADEEGQFGNQVGIVVDDGGNYSHHKRQTIATQSGFSEVVFINDIAKIKISIHNPQEEINFSGHAIIGAAFHFMSILKIDIQHIEFRTGSANVKFEGEKVWISSSTKNLPPWNFKQLDNRQVVEDFTREQVMDKPHTMIWSWIDQSKGIIRARTFAPDWGIPEDEANGSGAMLLAHQLNQNLTIIHGRGSIIHASPHPNDVMEIGGRVLKVIGDNK